MRVIGAGTRGYCLSSCSVKVQEFKNTTQKCHCGRWRESEGCLSSMAVIVRRRMTDRVS